MYMTILRVARAFSFMALVLTYTILMYGGIEANPISGAIQNISFYAYVLLWVIVWKFIFYLYGRIQGNKIYDYTKMALSLFLLLTLMADALHDLSVLFSMLWG